MKTYIFYYYDSRYDFDEGRKQEFSCSASRLSVAFNAFVDFVVSSHFYYFTFNNTYVVESKSSVHLRVLPTHYYLVLDTMRKLPNEIRT